MNEATFEARLNARIQNLFPAIDPTRISHQNIFDLKLGHHRITVDGKPKEKAGGRLDTVILVDAMPVLVFELKSPGVQINDADRDQGISYARLMDKMPPLVVISNGTETKFYTTCDKQLWTGSTISEETIKQLVQHALACAASDLDDAVRLLLGYRPEIWATIMRQTTESSLRDLTGEITDWSRPLSTSFSIPRQMAREIGVLLAKGNQVLIITGPPLSGKTNVLHQFCNADDHPNLIPLYIDGALVNFGLFQYLVNMFSKTLLRATPTEEIRQWLNVSLRGSPGKRLVFVIDGGITAADDSLATDLNQLLPLLESSNTGIVLALNDSLLSELINVSGRSTKTPLGRKARILELSALTDKEFPQALVYLAQRCSATFDFSIRNSQAFRQSRLLRVCAAQVASDRTHSPSKDDKEQKIMAVLPGVPSLGILKSAWNIFVRDPQLRDDLRRLAQAFITDERNRRESSSLSLHAHNTGIMTIRNAEDVLGTDRLNRLRSQGCVSLVNGPSGTTFCMPKLPEALSAAAAYEISAGFDSVMAQKGIEAACDYLLEKSEPLPYGDIVGALAIIDIASHSDRLSPVVSSLIQHRPVRKPMRNEAEIAILSAKQGEIRMRLPTESGQSLGSVSSNTHAWLILSHLATCPIVDAEGKWEPYLELLFHIGSYEYPLLRPDFIYLEDSTEFHIHEIEESGEVVCPRSGIVEPITLAIQYGFCHIPQEMLRLCRYAVEKNNIYLAYRLWTASISLLDSVESAVATAAVKAREILDPVIKKDIEDRCKPVVHAGRSSEASATKAKKMGRNELCPCGSGLKFKKCHGR